MSKNTSQGRIYEIKRKTVSGAIQLIAREVFIKIVVVIGQLLLVRLLAPSVFGLFAILSFILTTAEIFTDIGLNLAIIQKKEKPTNEQLSTIFFVKMFLSLLVVLLLNFVGPFIISYYHQLSSFEILMLRLLSLTLLIKPLPNIISSLLERDLRYKDIAIIDISGIITYYSTALILAFFNFGIWSFILAIVTKTIVESIATFLFRPFIPLFSFDLRKIREFINVGKYFQLGFFLTIIHNSIIPVVAGPRIALAQVGFLDWSYNTASFPRVFIDNLGRVSFSSFSRIQDKKEIIAVSIEKAFDILTVITVFFIVAVLVVGGDLIHYFLNDKWIPALPALKWYVLSIFFMNGTGLLGHALLALGKTKAILISVTLITALEFFGSFFLLKTLGFAGIAFGFFLITAITYFTYIFLCQKAGIQVNFARTIISSVFLFLTTLVITFLINIVLPQSLVYLVIKLGVSFAVYILFVKIAFPNSIEQSIRLLRIR